MKEYGPSSLQIRIENVFVLGNMVGEERKGEPARTQQDEEVATQKGGVEPREAGRTVGEKEMRRRKRAEDSDIWETVKRKMDVGEIRKRAKRCIPDGMETDRERKRFVNSFYQAEKRKEIRRYKELVKGSKKKMSEQPTLQVEDSEKRNGTRLSNAEYQRRHRQKKARIDEEKDRLIEEYRLSNMQLVKELLEKSGGKARVSAESCGSCVMKTVDQGIANE